MSRRVPNDLARGHLHGLGELLEAALQLLVGVQELLFADLEQLQRAARIARQAVDIALGTLHLGYYLLQFAYGLGVREVFLFFHFGVDQAFDVFFTSASAVPRASVMLSVAPG